MYRPKVHGAWNLHYALEAAGLNESLEIFMLFSSVTALVGNFGQTNYSAANGCLDALACWRQQQGLHAQSIQWGGWLEQGMAAALGKLLEKAGMRGISNELGLRVLGDVMRCSTIGVVCCQSIIWRNFLRRYAFEVPPFFSEVNTMGVAVSEPGIDVSNISMEELINTICMLAQQVSGSNELPSPNSPVLELGLDSLGAVEFRNSVADVTGTKLPQNLIFDNPTVTDIAQYIKNSSAVGDMSATSPTNLMDTPLDQWLMKSLDPQERFTLYIDGFSKRYDSVKNMANEEDIMTALEDIGVDDNNDFERLHVAWTDICDAVHVGRNAAGSKLKAGSGSRETTGLMKKAGPHPIEDVEMLTKALRFDAKATKPATPRDKVRKVLLTGATGFVGRVQVATLLKRGLTVYCIVRAKTQEHAFGRIKAACEEARCWVENDAKRLIVWPGDFEQEMLGLPEERYNEICKEVDIVYHTGGDVNLLSNYSRLRACNTLAISGIIETCTTYKLKPVHFASTLGQFPAFFAQFGGEFRSHVLTEESEPDMQEMERFYPPIRQGYPWSKWAAEQVLRKARDLGLPVYLYRLPNTYIAHKTGYTNRGDYAAALLIASLQEGIFPISAATSPITPVDTICDMLVDASLLESQQHWLYNLFDPRLVTMKEVEEWASEMGIYYKGVKADEFFSAVKARGPSSPVYKFLPLMQYWRKFWFDPGERIETFPIRNQNIFDELPQMEWPPQKEVFENSFFYSMELNFFFHDSASLILDPDYSLQEASRITGISAPLADKEFFMGPSHVIVNSFRNDCKPSFAGMLICYRTHRQHMINILAMQQMEEKYPEILASPITKPLIIVGLNRTGTTFLQNVLAEDPENRCTYHYEMMAPYGECGDFQEHGMTEENPIQQDPRLKFAQRTLDFLRVVGVDEKWASIHSQKADMPEEEFMILEQCGRCYSLCVEFSIPSYRRWLFANDYKEMKRGYTFHKRFLQHLSWQRKAQRWMLKMPFHLFTLDAMLEAYPDSMIVFTHRDPKEIMGSWGSLVKHTQSNILTTVDAAAIGQTELESMSSMIKKAIEFRTKKPEIRNQFFDVQYKDLIADPIATVKRIYKHFNLKLSRQAQSSMYNFIHDNRKLRDTMTKHTYALSDVGLTDGMVDAAFESYYKSGYLKYKK